MRRSRPTRRRQATRFASISPLRGAKRRSNPVRRCHSGLLRPARNDGAADYASVTRKIAAFLDDEFEQERRALFGDADRFLDAADDIARLFDAARRDVEALGHLGVVAADRHGAVLL